MEVVKWRWWVEMAGTKCRATDESGMEAIVLVACVPSRKSFLKRRAMDFLYRMRPVPSVRRRSAL